MEYHYGTHIEGSAVRYFAVKRKSCILSAQQRVEYVPGLPVSILVSRAIGISRSFLFAIRAATVLHNAANLIKNRVDCW